jgi:hypothetical protein
MDGENIKQSPNRHRRWRSDQARRPSGRPQTPIASSRSGRCAGPISMSGRSATTSSRRRRALVVMPKDEVCGQPATSSPADPARLARPPAGDGILCGLRDRVARRRVPRPVVPRRRGDRRPPAGAAHRRTHITADPTALLLVFYRRESLWKAIATGRMLAVGTPSLARSDAHQSLSKALTDGQTHRETGSQLGDHRARAFQGPVSGRQRPPAPRRPRSATCAVTPSPVTPAGRRSGQFPSVTRKERGR